MPNFSPGEAIEVRSEKEILATLDENGTLEGLPFIAEMRKYCGKKFKVLRRVTKIIVEGVGAGNIRNTVILKSVTCDGEANEGCDRTCLLLWKEAWLKRVDGNTRADQMADNRPPATEEESKGLPKVTPVCQSTDLLKAAVLIRKWDFRQYVGDVTSRTYGPIERISLLIASLSLQIQKLLVGKKPSSLSGTLRRTPSATLHLQPGELVEVKSKEEIIATLDSLGRNRGLYFTPEMVQYCGRKLRVLKRLDKMVNEKTGEMRKIANTVLLEGSRCDGKAHGGCQRLCYCLWREIWLRRIDG
jgi:hypothetical protein